MKLTEKKIKEKNKGQFIIAFEAEHWKKIINKAKSKILANLEVPGFRKGKVPANVAKEHLNDNKILNEAHKLGVEEAWKFTFKNELELKPFTRPNVIIDKLSISEYELTFEFELRPEVKLGQFKQLKIAKNEVKLLPEEVEQEINNLRQYLVVANEKKSEIEKGDFVIFDYKGFIDGKQFEGGSAENYELEIGSKSFIEGFEDQMIGLKAGDEKEINLTFPKDYMKKELAGKPVKFKLNIKAVKNKTLPEKDDILAKQSQIPGIETYAQLKKFIETNLLEEKKRREKDRFVNELLELIAKDSEIIIPDSAIAEEKIEIKKEFENALKEQQVDLKQYFEITKITEEKFENELQSEAFKKLRNFLILDEIMKSENINLTDEEIKLQVDKFAELYNINAEEKEKLKNQTAVIETLKKQKLIEFLYENNG